MWTFRDRSDHRWDVAVGRESWGTFVAIFIPGERGAELRQASLSAKSYAGANEELDSLDPEGWIELLARSEIKSGG